MPRLLVLATALCATASAFMLPTAPSVGLTPASTTTSSIASSASAFLPRVPLRWELQSTTDGQQTEAATMVTGTDGKEEEDKDSLDGWQLA